MVFLKIFSSVRRCGNLSTIRKCMSSAVQRQDKVLLLYHNPSQPRFIIVITIAAGIQLIFWGYLSYCALNDYHIAIQSESIRNNEQIKKRLESINAKSALKWRICFSLLALSLGTFFALTALMYPRRTINRLVFDSQNNVLKLSTYTPLGSVRNTQVSIMDVHSSTPSKSASSHLAIKVKDHSLYYLLDKKGIFPNYKLFDTLVGSRRS